MRYSVFFLALTSEYMSLEYYLHQNNNNNKRKEKNKDIKKIALFFVSPYSNTVLKLCKCLG